MVKTYINYPNTHMRSHRAATCGHVQPHAAVGQRYRRINIDNLSSELRAFIDRGHDFAAQQGLNDMWLEVDLGDDALEDAVLEFIRKTLAQRDTPFQRINVERRC